MDSLKNILDLEQNKIRTKYLIIYMLITYLFSVSVRLFLYYQISDNSNYFYNGNVIPLWTADAGLYGYYANQLLNGVSYPFISEYMPGYLLYAIVSITGWSIDTVLFFAPAFLASFVVIPIILIANHYRLALFGFYAALIGTVMTSYYYRTHLGYYDTDTLNAIFPLFAIYFLIRTVDAKKSMYAIYVSITLIVFNLWYHSSEAIILSIVAIYLLYVLLYERKAVYAYQSLFVIAIALLPLTFVYKILALITISLLLYGIHKYKDINYKYYLSILFIAIVAFFFLTNTAKYYERVDNYINKTSSIELKSSKGTFKLKSDLDTVAEAQSASLSQLIHRTSGRTPYFIIALLGYIALLIRYKSMLLTLPLALLTFIAMFAGLRFTIYGVMLFSFTMVFGVYLTFKSILVTWGDFSEKVSKSVSNIFLLLVLVLAMNNIVNYNKTLSPLYFSSTEDIEALHSLKNSSKKGDFILTWWDYGWPLWYYTNLKTLIDNGKHQQDNFIASKILLSDSDTFTKNASIFFIEKYIEGKRKKFSRVMDYFVANYPIDYLKELEKEELYLPVLNRDIYILLHKKMLSTVNTIELFSNIDLKSGKNYKSDLASLGYLNKKYDKSQKILEINNFTINLQKGEIRSKTDSMKRRELKNVYLSSGNVIPIRKISIFKESKKEFENIYLSENGLDVIINDDVVLIMKSKLYNSFLIQALLFNNYNRDYFTEVSRTKNFLILKVNNKKSKSN